MTASVAKDEIYLSTGMVRVDQANVILKPRGSSPKILLPSQREEIGSKSGSSGASKELIMRAWRTWVISVDRCCPVILFSSES